MKISLLFKLGLTSLFIPVIIILMFLAFPGWVYSLDKDFMNMIHDVIAVCGFASMLFFAANIRYQNRKKKYAW